MKTETAKTLKTQTVTRPRRNLQALFTAPDPAATALVPQSGGPPAVHPTTSHSLLLPAPRPRFGKIARLPKPVRHVVNRMLFLHISQDRIVDALHELGFQVTQQNLSNWKNRGGYREWCLAQEHALHLRIHQDTLVDLLRRYDAPELSEVGLQAAATQLSQFFLTAEARQLLASDPKEYERRVSMLARISSQLESLQKSRDDSPRYLKPDRDPDKIPAGTDASLARLTDAYTCTPGESARDPDIPHRNLLPPPGEPFTYTDLPPAFEKEDRCLEQMLDFLRCASGAKPSAPATNENKT